MQGSGRMSNRALFRCSTVMVVRTTYVVLLLSVSCTASSDNVAPTVSKTLVDYGYYYGLSPRDGLAGFANHSTTTFVQNSAASGASSAPNITLLAERDIADLIRLRAHGLTAILASVQYVFGSQANLSRTWEADLARYWELLKPYSENILAWYPADEPTQLQVKEGVYGTMTRALKKLAPHIPILAVITPSETLEMEQGTFELPPEVDWFGMDNYNCWGRLECEATPPRCCWMNRTMPQNLAVIEAYAKKRGGKMVVVADGMSAAANLSIVPTAAEQQLRVARDQKYLEWCDSHELCVAMLVFLWNTVSGGEDIFGVSAQPIVLSALTEIGLKIKHRHLALSASAAAAVQLLQV